MFSGISLLTKLPSLVTLIIPKLFSYLTSFLIRSISVAYGRTHPNPAEFSVTGPNNTTMYPISENNYIADQIRWANNDPNVV